MRKLLIILIVLVAAFSLFASGNDTDERYNSLSVRLTPYSIGLFDFYNGHDVENARYFTYSGYGMTVGLDYSYRILDWLSADIDTSYRMILKKSTTIPNAKDVHYIDMLAGVSFYLPYDRMEAYLGLLLGGVMQHNYDRTNLTFGFGAKCGMSFALTDSLWLGFDIRSVVSYTSDDDSLYRSFSYLIDTASLTAAWRF